MNKQYWFGAGNMYFINPAASPATPVKAGTLQEGSVEFAFTEKQVFGQNQFPDDIFRSQGKITGKSKMAQIRMDLLASFFSGTPATGQLLPAVAESQQIPAAAPYTVTVANAANFSRDLGVVRLNADGSATPMTCVASGSEAAGKYSVSAVGVYTFAAADEGLHVLIDYLYTGIAGKSLALANQLAGIAPVFLCVLNNITGVTNAVMVLNKCMSSKLTLASKVGEVMIPEFDFSASADDAGNIGTLNLPL